MNHPCFKIKAEELLGKLRPPKGFDGFKSGIKSFPNQNMECKKALYLGDFRGDSKIVLNNSFVGIQSKVSGDIHTDLQGVNFLKRIFTIPKDEELKLSYISRDSVSFVDDVIYLGENSRLIYDGRFKINSGEFVNNVRVIHSKPDANSEVNIKGLVHDKATILPVGEFLLGSAGSTTSVNGFVVMFGEGKAHAVPKLLIGDPETKAYHSFKKLQMTPEQMFYLSSRGLMENNIEALYERFILGV